jgi:hypothetical protein
MNKTKQEWKNISYVHRLFGDRKRGAVKDIESLLKKASQKAGGQTLQAADC